MRTANLGRGSSLPRLLACAGALLAGAGLAGAAAPDDPLGGHFGFEAARFLVLDRDCGPVVTADFNGDGRPDLAVVNNAKSRLEVYLLRATPKTQDELERDLKVNQLRPTPHYDRREVSLPQRVTALRPADIDGDGKADLVYAGVNPAEIVVLRQVGDAEFRPMSRQRVRGLAARQGGLFVEDVMGDAAPEVVTIAEERIAVYPIDAAGVLGEPRRLGSSGQPLGLLVEDYDGDGLKDVLAAVADEQIPLRLWLQRQDPRTSGGKRGLLGAELRFESPALRDATTARFPGRPGASLGVIERISRRVVFYDLVSGAVEPIGAGAAAGEREVQAEVYGFADGANKDRSVALADVDGDGLADLLSVDPKSNTVVLHRQARGIGLGDAEPFSAFKQPKAVAVAPAGAWGEATTATVFVLSEEEKVVGAAAYDATTRKLGFPRPLPIKTAGASPVAMAFVMLDGKGTLAVIARNRRDHVLELHTPGAGENGVTTVALTGVTRPPQGILAADADQDGRMDLLLFTAGEPMAMVRSATDVLTSEQMANFGLVQGAGANNTALMDVDGDGKAELLVAEKNFVRAARFDAKDGWRVVTQTTVAESGTDLVGLTVLGGAKEAPVAVASDKGNNRLVMVDPVKREVTRRIRLAGLTPGPIFAGSFAGDGEPSLLSLADDAFGLVRLAGSRPRLESFAAFRSDAKDRAEHELEIGDVNGDGNLDAIVLDAGEQMCSLLTFTDSRKLLPATEFKVFESKLFTGGDGREFEPRDALVADLTGDGKADLLLLVHDRLIIYPQMTRPLPPRQPEPAPPARADAGTR